MKPLQKDPFAAASSLTEEIHHHLEKQVVAIEDEKLDKLVKDIEHIYKSKVMMERGFLFRHQDEDFIVTKDISGRVHYFSEHQPERLERFRLAVEEYKEQLSQLGINDLSVRSLGQQRSLLRRTLGAMTYFIIGFPLFLFGAINNYIPYKLPLRIAKKLSSEPQFHGALMMVVGTVLFAILWLLQMWLVHHFTHSWTLSLLYLAL